MKAIFMGTPDFAVPSLETIYGSEFDLALVLTQPDRKKDRGKKLQPPPVKVRAEELGIEVYQPEKIKSQEAIEKIKQIHPDIILVTAYGQILPKEILAIPKYGCINVHASLLPAYRGAAPINFALIHGEKYTGITTMYMAEGLDTGDMIFQDSLVIEEDWTAETLHNQLAELSRKTLIRTLNEIIQGTAPRIPQQEEDSSYAKMMDKSLGHINWQQSAIEIHNLIRGTYPWPGAFTYYQGEVMKVIRAQLTEEKSSLDPGTIQRVTHEGIFVSTKDKLIKITEIQMPGKKKIPVSEYIKGNEIKEKILLG